MKIFNKLLIIATVVIIGFSMTTCDNSGGGGDDSGGKDIKVTLLSVTVDGSITQATTQLTLTFNEPIEGLTYSDITLSGAPGVGKGTLTGSNPYYLPILNNTTSRSLKVSVSKSGYSINGSPKTVIVYIGNGDFLISSSGIEMCFVPSGSFQMGNPDTSVGNTDERPVHSVTLSDFYMGKYEVTQEQYQAVMGNNPSYFTSSPASGEVQNKRPVEQVNWYDALVFCNKLSIKEELSPAYKISGNTDPSAWGNVPYYDIATNKIIGNTTVWDAVQIVSGSTGYRLPTEAQWEYAAKGGEGSPNNYTYAGSNTVGDVWYKGNSSSKTHEVGKKTPNELGLYDMSGNVGEWCWDTYESYSSGVQTDPINTVSGSNRVIRGGSYSDSAEWVRSACRSPFYSYYVVDYGFRLVRPKD